MVEEPIIALIIESPHKDKYFSFGSVFSPIGHAQEKTGERIEKHLEYLFNNFIVQHITKLGKHSFDVIICNPVPNKYFPSTRQAIVTSWGKENKRQGLASIILLDYLRTNSISLNISKIIAIEPSELAIKRAALHINSVNNKIQIKTICKHLDELHENNLFTDPQSIKIHLFSNILDLDDDKYSQGKLIKLIIKSQENLNYFICVSPYITDEKADRIDSFKRYFQKNYNSFVSYVEDAIRPNSNSYWNCNIKYTHKSICAKPCPCSSKWTKITRVFSIDKTSE